MAQVCLVMELAKGGELFDKLLEQGSLSEQVAGRLMAQVCQPHLHPGTVLTSCIKGSRGTSRSSLQKNCTQRSQTGKFVIL